jgi:YkoY family integral membrane protein
MALAGIEFSLDTIFMLVTLVAMETVLSADNAVALAALAQPIQDPCQRQQVLNWGLVIAFVLRVGLLLTATWVVQFWPVELLGAGYLLWLGGKHFWPQIMGEERATENAANPVTCSLMRVIGLIALTDLAFSLDSVTTAIALSDQLWLVITGCAIGVITLRCLAGLFVRCLEEFIYLQDAAYLAVLGVGVQLLCKVVHPALVPPQSMVLAGIAALFAWGFSKRVELER